MDGTAGTLVGEAAGEQPRAYSSLKVIFDADYYRRQPGLVLDGMNPLTHYLARGWKEGRQPCALFDSSYYLSHYPDAAATGLNPLLHYITIGARQSLAPSPLFDPAYYCEQIPDALFVNPLAHYLACGAAAGLSPHPLFDPAFYLERAPHARERGRTLLEHFSEFAAAEKLSPHRLFDTVFYLERNAEIANGSINPLAHYVTQGWREGRDPSASFSTQCYLDSNQDIARAGINPLRHYATHGMKEGRAPAKTIQVARPALRPANGRSNIAPRFPSLAQGPEFAPSWTCSAIANLFSDHAEQIETLPNGVVDLSLRILGSCHCAPRVSVIIPTWNRRSTVCSAIRSALNQRYRPFEIIVSDDGSEDGTVDEVQANFPGEVASGQIKIVRNKHLGVSAARNAGLKAATGDLIAYLDSDNCWRRDYLLIMCAAFAEREDLFTAYAGLKWCNRTTGEVRYRATAYERKRLITNNFIDLNIFMHRRQLFEQLGGFDERLTRLVDWDLIVRYTGLFPPMYLPFCGVDYFLDREGLNNITFTEGLERNYRRIARKNMQERVRRGVDQLRLAYFIYDFPALSQTFVMNELRWLVKHGVDVKVYHKVDPDKSCSLDFDVEVHRVNTAEELAQLLVQHNRNHCHGHFAYPGVTLFVRPACEIADITYTFMAHAVDIFHHHNRERADLATITNDERCLKAFVHGGFQRTFLEAKGARPEKIAYVMQAVELDGIEKASRATRPPLGGRKIGVCIGRLIEKKGIQHLIEAANLLRGENVEFHIYGYGPLRVALEARVQALALENVIFKGLFEGADQLAQVYASCDFLVAPCVEASNGDIDGFPTVILEAMAAGKPVVTTSVAAIPDYLRDGIEAHLARPGDAQELADKIRDLITSTESRQRAMTAAAGDFLRKCVGVESTMTKLMDLWCGYIVDIFLITYNTPKYDQRRDTFEIVRRLMMQTTTPHRVTIFDNCSDEDFWSELKSLCGLNPNVRLIRSSRNLFCGPASNIALALGDSEFGIYVCSKEGFAKGFGWERPIIDYMRKHPEVAVGGYLTHLPKFTYGRELAQLSSFEKFRNGAFARKHGDRPFKHIQGGVYILRRSTLEKYGWFNPELPQDHMDVEYSYFLESCGAKLGEIPEIRAISIKTRPPLTAVIDETTTIAHPLSTEIVGHQLDASLTVGSWRCNLCETENHRGAAVNPACTNCKSTPFGRSVFRLLAHDHRGHRGNVLCAVTNDPALGPRLGERMFQIGRIWPNGAEYRVNRDACISPSILVLDLDLFSERDLRWLEAWLDEAPLDLDGRIVLAPHSRFKSHLADRQGCRTIRHRSSFLELDPRELMIFDKYELRARV